MLKQILVMGLLTEGPRHGYEINKIIKGSMQRVFDLNPASTYYTLEKLEKDNLVKKSKTQEGRRPQKYVYRLTDNGRQELIKMLEQALASEEDPVCPIDIGLVFIDKLDPERARKMLRKRIDSFKEELQKLIELRDNGPKLKGVKVPDHNWMIEHKIAHLKAEIDWEEKFLVEQFEIR